MSKNWKKNLFCKKIFNNSLGLLTHWQCSLYFLNVSTIYIKINFMFDNFILGKCQVCLHFVDDAAVVKIKSQKKRNSFEVFEVADNKAVNVN